MTNKTLKRRFLAYHKNIMVAVNKIFKQNSLELPGRGQKTPLQLKLSLFSSFGNLLYLAISSWILKRWLVVKNLATFTRTTLKPRFYVSNQPHNHTKEKGEGKEGSGEEKKTLYNHYFYIADFGTTENRALVQTP